MKKLIFCDIDDTIRPKDGEISEFTIETIKKLKNKAEFVLVTGRNRERTEIFASAYGGCRYIIDANGGEVFDTIKREVIYSAKCAKDAVKQLYELSKKYGVVLILNISADFRFVTEWTHKVEAEKKIEDIDYVLDNYDVVGGLFLGIKDSDLASLKSEILEIEGLTIGNKGITEGDNFVDFVSEYANKGVAVRKLMRHLGVSYENTFAVGDGINDVAMFSATAHNVVVGNACDEIKAMADIIVDTAKNDGPAKFFRDNFMK